MKSTSTFIRRIAVLSLTFYMLLLPCAFAWTDQAHLAMGKAAGFRNFHNCAAPDNSHTVAAINGLTQSDAQGHFFNAPADYTLTVDDIYEQLEAVGASREECPLGYLLGVTLQAVRMSKARTESGDYDNEYYAVLLHYIADISMPLHMSVYDDFNRTRHLACDDILSDTEAEYPVLAAIALADELEVDDTIRFTTEEELLDAVITLARQSQALANTIRAEDRILTREEALTQLSRSATLGRAALRYCGKLQ